MASHSRVLNQTNGCKLKRSQALRRIEQCLSAWVETGYTIRDLTLAERITARKEQAKLQEPLARAEIPGFHVQWNTEAQQNIARKGYQLLKSANQFCAANA